MITNKKELDNLIEILSERYRDTKARTFAEIVSTNSDLDFENMGSLTFLSYGRARKEYLVMKGIVEDGVPEPEMPKKASLNDGEQFKKRLAENESEMSIEEQLDVLCKRYKEREVPQKLSDLICENPDMDVNRVNIDLLITKQMGLLKYLIGHFASEVSDEKSVSNNLNSSVAGDKLVEKSVSASNSDELLSESSSYGIFEAALVLDAVFATELRSGDRMVIADQLSKGLRKLASNLKKSYDESYRSVSDINYHMQFMERVYYGKKAEGRASGVFDYIVSVYKNSNDKYKSILSTAKWMIDGENRESKNEEENIWTADVKNEALEQEIDEKDDLSLKEQLKTICERYKKREVPKSLEEIKQENQDLNVSNLNSYLVDKQGLKLTRYIAEQINLKSGETRDCESNANDNSDNSAELERSNNANVKSAQDSKDGVDCKTEKRSNEGKMLSDHAPYDRCEAAILLDACVEIISNKINKMDIVSRVSRELRAIAKNEKKPIDETYRPISEICSQVEIMRGVYYDEDKAAAAPEVFFEVVNLYKNNNIRYQELLLAARKKISGNETGKTDVDEDVLSVRTKFSEYEAALLLEKCIEIYTLGKNRMEAVAQASEDLREMARNEGKTIGDTYRSLNDISCQMDKMKAVYFLRGKNAPVLNDKRIPKLFKDIVTLYYNDNPKYRELLSAARSMVNGEIDKMEQKEVKSEKEEGSGKGELLEKEDEKSDIEEQLEELCARYVGKKFSKSLTEIKNENQDLMIDKLNSYMIIHSGTPLTRYVSDFVDSKLDNKDQVKEKEEHRQEKAKPEKSADEKNLHGQDSPNSDGLKVKELAAGMIVKGKTVGKEGSSAAGLAEKSDVKLRQIEAGLIKKYKHKPAGTLDQIKNENADIFMSDNLYYMVNRVYHTSVIEWLRSIGVLDENEEGRLSDSERSSCFSEFIRNEEDKLLFGKYIYEYRKIHEELKKCSDGLSVQDFYAKIPAPVNRMAVVTVLKNASWIEEKNSKFYYAQLETDNLMFKMEVNYSLLTEGLTVPVQTHDLFCRINGKRLEPGEKESVKIVLNGKTYSAEVRNIKFSPKYNRKIVQIRYRKNGDLAKALQQCFHRSYELITESREKRLAGDRTPIAVPESEKEILAVYKTELEDTYLFEPDVIKSDSAAAKLKEGEPEHPEICFPEVKKLADRYKQEKAENYTQLFEENRDIDFEIIKKEAGEKYGLSLTMYFQRAGIIKTSKEKLDDISRELVKRYRINKAATLSQVVKNNSDIVDIGRLNQFTKDVFQMTAKNYLLKIAVIEEEEIDEGPPVEEKLGTIVEELKKRYKDEAANTLTEVTKDNGDIENIGRMNEYTRELYDLTAKEYLVRAGVIVPKEVSNKELSSAERLSEITEILKSRYEGEKAGSISEVFEDNNDLNVSGIGKWSKDVYNETAEQYLVEQGIMEGLENQCDATVHIRQEELNDQGGEQQENSLYIHNKNIDTYDDEDTHLAKEKQLEYSNDDEHPNAIDELIGIVEGIGYDGIINEFEVYKLSAWIEDNKNLLKNKKYGDFYVKLKEILSDGIIDDNEREYLVKKSYEYKSNVDTIDSSLRVLKGILSGIVCDDAIADEEVLGLKEWIFDNEELEGIPVYDNVREVIENILEDDIISAEEKEYLLVYINNIIRIGSCDDEEGKDDNVLDAIQDDELTKLVKCVLEKYDGMKTKDIVKHIPGAKTVNVNKILFLKSNKDCFVQTKDYSWHLKSKHEKLSEHEVEVLEQFLVDDIQNLKHLKEQFYKHVDNADVEKVNEANLRKLGYSISGNVVYRGVCDSIGQFLSDYALQKEIIDFSDVQFVFKNTQVKRFLNKLEKEKKIIRFDEHKYITIKKLEMAGISKDLIDDFCRKAIGFADGKYFNSHWLLKCGFNHELYKLGFEMEFYESVFKAHSGCRSISINEVCIFTERSQVSGVRDIVEEELQSVDSIDVYDMIDYFRDMYGIKIGKKKLENMLKDADVYYSGTMERIYCDYDTFFEEV